MSTATNRARSLERLERRIDKDLSALSLIDRRKARALSLQIAEEKLQVEILKGTLREIRDRRKALEDWIAIHRGFNLDLEKIAGQEVDEA